MFHELTEYNKTRNINFEQLYYMCEIYEHHSLRERRYNVKPILILVMVTLRLETTELLDDYTVGCRQVHKHNGSKNKHDVDYTYLLEPFGGQVFESGPNNTKHVTCNGLTLHKQTNKQTKDRFPSVFMLLVYAATRDALHIEICICLL